MVLGEAVATHGVPGAVVGVLAGGVVHTASVGVTSIEHPSPVGPQTLFQVGSISKTFTSAAALLLVEEGRLDLADPVARHLPHLGPATGLDLEAITVERALSHQSGFDGDHLFVVGASEGLAALAGARRLFDPGTGYSYSNAGFSLIGAVIEAVTGRSFEAFVRERLLRPLGMSSATFRADEAITNPVALPHWVFEGTAHLIRKAGWQPGWELAPIDHAAAGLIASVDHLLEWCRFQGTGATVDGSALLGPASLQRLHTPLVRADLTEEVGLDWSVRPIDGVTTIGHDGSTAGYISELLVVPDRKMAFVGLTNATNGSAALRPVRRWALERFAGLVERDPEPDPSIVVDRARFVGSYLHSFGRMTVTEGDQGGTIVVTPSPRDDVDGWQPPPDRPSTLAFFAPDHAVRIGDPGPARVVRFGFGADGRAEWLQWGGRRAPRA